MAEEAQKNQEQAETEEASNQSQLGAVVEKMFQDESDRIVNEEDPDAKRGKRTTIIIGLIMALIVLLTLIYRII
ncbi:hypothetical protein [Lactococcus termiticola]|uniref:Uncharacterized protein n=1 Tax=Lactococcus termiticola TaxID=2169526 RepID=A0A2R5HIY2_9LACT|nr:hypothetical protein [Lactococcus termiticola]GBG96360.1 hypothetical protein NtB2_00471 [Lactococcus termiticola]